MHPLLNPCVPFVHPICEPVVPGVAIEIDGSLKCAKHTKVFVVELLSGPDHVFHMSFRFHKKEHQIVMNSSIKGKWQKEERVDNPFGPDDHNFHLSIRVEEGHFDVLVHNRCVATFTHRFLIQSIRALSVNGDVQIHQVQFNGFDRGPAAISCTDRANPVIMPQIAFGGPNVGFSSGPPGYTGFGSTPPQTGPRFGPMAVAGNIASNNSQFSEGLGPNAGYNSGPQGYTGYGSTPPQAMPRYGPQAVAGQLASDNSRVSGPNVGFNPGPPGYAGYGSAPPQVAPRSGPQVVTGGIAAGNAELRDVSGPNVGFNQGPPGYTGFQSASSQFDPRFGPQAVAGGIGSDAKLREAYGSNIGFNSGPPGYAESQSAPHQMNQRFGPMVNAEQPNQARGRSVHEIARMFENQ